MTTCVYCGGLFRSYAAEIIVGKLCECQYPTARVEDVKTPPPLTPKDSLSVEVEERLEAIRRDFILRDSHIVLDDVASRHVNSLFAIIRELQKEIRCDRETIDMLEQSSGDMCGVCGWLGIRDNGCEFCQLATAQAQLRRKDEALEKLSKLGNGELCGNSVGNQIARAALADGKEGGR